MKLKDMFIDRTRHFWIGYKNGKPAAACGFNQVPMLVGIVKRVTCKNCLRVIGART